MSRERHELLTGWGRTTWSSSTVAAPSDVKDVVATVNGAGPRGLITRGLGRSYGDQAQNAGGIVLDMGRMDRVLSLDAEAGTLSVQGGARIGSLMQVLGRRGLALPVVPGTSHVTVGGAVAADVHGKNHHRDGGFGHHVTRMTLVTADGEVREVRPGSGGDPDLFWGTLGGLGLTGVVLDVDLELLPVPTSWMSVDVVRAPDVDELLSAVADADTRRYSVAWVDCLARGRQAGRGVVTSAEHAGPDEVVAARSRRRRRDSRHGAPAAVRVPGVAPPGLLNRWSAAAFNAAWFHASRSGTGILHTPSSYFFPLDAVEGWNRLYGPQGLVQYQCVVPDGAPVRDLLTLLRSAAAPVFLAVLKRFGRPDEGVLSSLSSSAGTHSSRMGTSPGRSGP